MVSPSARPSAPVAAPAEAAESAVTAPPDDAADEPPDLEAEARRLKKLFEAFKAEPTREKLDELMQLIADWEEAANDDPLMLISQESEFVEKLRKLLQAKGAQFVAQKSG